MQSLFFGSLFILSLFLLSLDKRLFPFHCIVWIPAILTTTLWIINDMTSLENSGPQQFLLDVLVSVYLWQKRGMSWIFLSDLLFLPPWDALLAFPTLPLPAWLCSVLSLMGEIWSILSISADIETIGEILLKIIPTLEEVGTLRTCLFLPVRTSWTQWPKLFIWKWKQWWTQTLAYICTFICRDAF